jgi:hypothetical protein
LPDSTAAANHKEVDLRHATEERLEKLNAIARRTAESFLA